MTYLENSTKEKNDIFKIILLVIEFIFIFIASIVLAAIAGIVLIIISIFTGIIFIKPEFLGLSAYFLFSFTIFLNILYIFFKIDKLSFNNKKPVEDLTLEPIEGF